MTDAKATTPRSPERSNLVLWLLFALACAPYFINDLAFAWLVTKAPAWSFYFTDYGFRLIGLAILFGLPALRAFAWPVEDGRFRLALTVLLAAVVLVIGHGLGLYLRIPLNSSELAWNLFHFSRLENPWLHAFDLTAGLLLVATSEELLYRRVAWRLLQRFNFSTLSVALISSALFAAMHWGRGPGNIAETFVIGLLLMAIYQRWRSLGMVVTIHFVMDFKVFL